MNKKSFWRGFGIGVLFAAGILGLSCLIRTSDANVISRAKKLGMEFAQNEKVGALATASPKVEQETKQKSSVTAKPSATGSEKAGNGTDSSQSVKSETETKSDSSEKKTDEKKKNMEQEKEKMEKEIRSAAKRLEIDAGDWSDTVSRELEKLGVVDSAKEFDRYLNENGYSNSINAGTYDVSVEDTYEELARKITGK